MPRLTIEIPGEGVWDAATCGALTSTKIVLENFRVVPFQSGVVRVRTTPCAARVRPHVGTPVTIRPSEEAGVVLMVDETSAMVERSSDGVVVLVDVESLAYRMNISIDDLETTLIPFTTRTIHGVEYLIPDASESPATALEEEDEARVDPMAEDAGEEDEDTRETSTQSAHRRLCVREPFHYRYNQVRGGPILLVVARHTVYEARRRPAYALTDPRDGTHVYVSATANLAKLAWNARTAWCNYTRRRELGRTPLQNRRILATLEDGDERQIRTTRAQRV